MNNIKHIFYIIAAFLPGIIFVTSCSERKDESTVKNGKKSAITAKYKNFINKDKSHLNAIRKGQYVDLIWQLDTTGVEIKQIDIYRSLTGLKGQIKIAGLEPEATRYQDCLPDESPYWYGLRLVTKDDGTQILGTVRVERDQAGSDNYIKLSELYKVSATRTDYSAKLKWDFPESEYKRIAIARSTQVAKNPFKDTKNTIVKTLEGKSQYADILPDPNSEYWYWFRLSLKNGTIIDLGPVRAEFDSQ